MSSLIWSDRLSPPLRIPLVTDTPGVPESTDAQVIALRPRSEAGAVPQWLSARNPTDAQVASVRRHPASHREAGTGADAVQPLTAAQRAAIDGHPLAGLRVVRQLDRELGPT